MISSVEYMILFAYIGAAAWVTYAIYQCMIAVITVYEENF
jgi:hypothetical protein